MEIKVLGAGVVGLTTAVVLRRRGHRVTVKAESRTPGTQSDTAAAIHFPFMVEPRDQAARWSLDSLERFRTLTGPDTGISMRETFIEWRKEETPWWVPLVVDPRPSEPLGEKPGWRCELPVIAMPAYMRWLEARFRCDGGVMENGRVQHIYDEIPAGGLVVNCTGLGAHALTGDKDLHPVRGQVVRVQDRGVPTALMLEDPLCYVVPRGDGAVVGGTADRNQWDLTPNEDVRTSLLAEARKHTKGLGDVIEDKVGLRPARSSVRLERNGKVIHNYGHGGAGVTLSWGCALAVADLVH